MLKMSVDDGCASDVRVAQLAEKYEIPTVFYWPVEWQTIARHGNYQPLSVVDAGKIARKHEVGSHTVTHRLLTRIPEKEAIHEIIESKALLGKIFGKMPNKFAPPRGYTNESLTEITLSVYDSQRLTRGYGLVHVHPRSGVNENKHWLEYAAENTVEEIWMHSSELDLYDEWDNLEQYLRSYYGQNN